MDTVAQLTQLRQDLEQQIGSSVADLEINAACVLYDVAKFLQLSRDETRQVIGQQAFARITKGHILHVNGQPCPFDSQCSLTKCRMEQCERFGERWAFIQAFNCREEVGDG